MKPIFATTLETIATMEVGTPVTIVAFDLDGGEALCLRPDGLFVMLPIAGLQVPYGWPYFPWPDGS